MTGSSSPLHNDSKTDALPETQEHWKTRSSLLASLAIPTSFPSRPFLEYRCASTDRKKSKLERMCLLGRHQREGQGNCTVKTAESCDCEHADVAPTNCEQVVHLTRVVTLPRMCSIRSTHRSPDVRFCGEPWQAAQTVFWSHREVDVG